MADLSTWRALAELMTAAGRPRDSLIRSRRTPVDVRFWRLRLRARVPGTMPACVSGAWRLVGDPSRPLGDRGEIAGLDQFVRLKMREDARTGGRAQRGHGARIGQLEDAYAVVASEHPVVRFKPADGPRHPPHDSCPVRGRGDEPFDRLIGEAEQDQVLCHYYHPGARTQI